MQLHLSWSSRLRGGGSRVWDSLGLGGVFSGMQASTCAGAAAPWGPWGRVPRPTAAVAPARVGHAVQEIKHGLQEVVGVGGVAGRQGGRGWHRMRGSD